MAKKSVLEEIQDVTISSLPKQVKDTPKVESTSIKPNPDHLQGHGSRDFNTKKDGE